MKAYGRVARTLLVAVTVGTVAVGTVGCGPSGGDGTAEVTGTPGLAGGESPNAVTPLPTSPPATIAASVFLATPEAAAEHLYLAWKADDTPAALRGASDAAVNALFTRTWESGTYFFGGCTQPSAPSECHYNWSQGVVAMDIDSDPVTGFRVVAVSFDTAG